MADDLSKDLELDEAEETVQKSADEKSSGTSGASKASAGAAKSKKSKPSVGARITKYLRDLRGEFKKIIWPTRKVVARNTIVTIVMCAIVGALVCAIDFGLGRLIAFVLGLKKKA